MIVGLGAAAKLVLKNLERFEQNMLSVRNYLESRLEVHTRQRHSNTSHIKLKKNSSLYLVRMHCISTVDPQKHNAYQTHATYRLSQVKNTKASKFSTK
jgi:hypothetical protein